MAILLTHTDHGNSCNHHSYLASYTPIGSFFSWGIENMHLNLNRLLQYSYDYCIDPLRPIKMWAFINKMAESGLYIVISCKNTFSVKKGAAK